MTSLEYQLRSDTLGDLTCSLVEPNQPATHLIVLLHGYGAPGTDLVGLAEPILRSSISEDLLPLFIFPHAPISLADQGMPGGRAWWPLNMARLLEATTTGSFDELKAEVPPGIESANAKLETTIDAAFQQHAVAARNFVLGGFSQGCMLATNYILGSKAPNVTPKLMIGMSGALICEAIWNSNLERLDNMQVLLGHGRQDPILPFTTGEWLNELFDGSKCEKKWLPFDGPHTIHDSMLAAIPSSLRAMMKTDEIGNE